MTNNTDKNRKILTEIYKSILKEKLLYVPDNVYLAVMSNGGAKVLAEDIVNNMADDAINAAAKLNPENLIKNAINDIGNLTDDDAANIANLAAAQGGNMALEKGWQMIRPLTIRPVRVAVDLLLEKVNPISQVFVGMPTRSNNPHIQGEAVQEGIKISIEEFILKEAYSGGFRIASAAVKGVGNMLAKAGEFVYCEVGGLLSKYAPRLIFKDSTILCDAAIKQMFKKNSLNFLLKNMLDKIGLVRVLKKELTEKQVNKLVINGASKAAARAESKELMEQSVKTIIKKFSMSEIQEATRTAVRTTIREFIAGVSSETIIGPIIEAIFWVVLDALLNIAARLISEDIAEGIMNANAQRIQDLYDSVVTGKKNMGMQKLLAQGGKVLLGTVDLVSLVKELAAERHFYYRMYQNEKASNLDITGYDITGGVENSAMQDVNISDEDLLEFKDKLSSQSALDFYLQTTLKKLPGLMWTYHPLFGISLYCTVDYYYYLRNGFAIQNPKLYGKNPRSHTIGVKRSIVSIGGQIRNFDKEFNSMETQLLYEGINVDAYRTNALLSSVKTTQELASVLNKIHNKVIGKEINPYYSEGDVQNTVVDDLKSSVNNAADIVSNMASNPFTTQASLIDIPKDFYEGYKLFISEGKVEGIEKLSENTSFNTLYGKNTKFKGDDGREYMLDETGNIIDCETNKIVEKSECQKLLDKKNDLDKIYNGVPKGENEKFLDEWGWDYTKTQLKPVQYQARNQIWHFVNKIFTGDENSGGNILSDEEINENRLPKAIAYRKEKMKSYVIFNNEKCVFIEYLSSEDVNVILGRMWYKLLAYKDFKVIGGHNYKAKLQTMLHRIHEHAEEIYPYTSAAGFSIPEDKTISSYYDINNNSDQSNNLTNLKTTTITGSKSRVGALKRAGYDVTKMSEKEIEDAYNKLFPQTAINEDTEANKEQEITNCPNDDYSTSVKNIKGKPVVYVKIYFKDKQGEYLKDQNGKYEFEEFPVYKYTYQGGTSNFIIEEYGKNYYDVYEIFLNKKNYKQVGENIYEIVNDSNFGLVILFKKKNIGIDMFGDILTIGSDKKVQNTQSSIANTNIRIPQTVQEKKNIISGYINADYAGFLNWMAEVSLLDNVNPAVREMFRDYVWPGARYFYDNEHRDKRNFLIKNGFIRCDRIVSEEEVWGNVLVGKNLFD